MIHIKNVLDRVTPLGAAATLLVSVAVPALAFRQASAAALTERSLMVTSTVANDDITAPDETTYTGLPAGDPRNGAQVGHTYEFNISTAGTIQGFTIEYCEKAFDFVGSGACSASNLLDAGDGFSASDWDQETVTINGVAFDVTANEANYLTLTSATGIVGLTAGATITIDFPVSTAHFVNPSTAYKATSNGTYFAHIQTFADEAVASGAFADAADEPSGVVDDGTVTNNITNAIGIYTRVQETLNFSVEGDLGSQHNSGTLTGPTAATAACHPLTAADSGILKMGDPNSALEPETANKVTSYFRLSTNASQGTAVHYSGDTLKNANHSFAASATATPYASGTEAFGLAINTDAGSHTSFTELVASPEYSDAQGNNFALNTGSVSVPEVIAETPSVSPTVVKCDTGQVDYMASIAPETPAGIYQTKINYIASPKY